MRRRRTACSRRGAAAAPPERRAHRASAASRHGAPPVVEVGWSDRRPLAAYCALLAAAHRAGIEFRRHGSGALAWPTSPPGCNDGYIELHINAWDALAGILLVQEAGGRTNDFLADGGLTRGNLLVAATPQVKGVLVGLTGARTAEIVGLPPERPR